MSLTSISMYCELTKPRFENFQHLITLLKEKSIFLKTSLFLLDLMRVKTLNMIQLKI